jgi:rhodanese-related sulfurtransferase
MPERPGEPQASRLDLFSCCCELPAVRSPSSSKQKTDRRFSVLLSQGQQSGLACRFCCQDGLKV